MGTYVVETTCDVPNPHKDGRSRDWNKKPTVPAGSRFIIRHGSSMSSSTRGAGESGYGWEPLHSELAKLIFANAHQVPPKSVKELAEVYDCNWGGDEILRILIKLGRVGPDDFAAVTAAVDADENF